ncbi:MAG: ABC transporter permease, partial [Treponema sp.]|nr:ABC transporter permease [Treponema sp.]
ASGIGFVYRWNELNVAQFQNFSSTKMMLILIMILIVLVASINIASAIVMLVMERKKEIAILKSIGASSSGIALSFILAGVFCGLTGVVIGLPIGLICSVNVNEIIFFIEKIVNFCSKILYIIKGNNIESFVATNLMDPAYYLTHIPITIPVQELLLIVISVLFLSFLVSLIPSIKAGKEKPLDIFRKV